VLDIIVNVTPADVVLNPDDGSLSDSSFLCTISGTKDVVFAFLTGSKSPSELISTDPDGATDKLVITGSSDALDRILVAFNLSLASYSQFTRENAYDLEGPEYGPTGMAQVNSSQH
jgi:hypothetical protein